MAGFFKKLVGNMPFARGEARQGVFLCAFGKHPGERDHFEYMPPDSKKLSDVWHFLYDSGMKVLVPQWKALLPAERLDAFNHIFVWRDGERVVAGRMWSSSDGASPPRKDFPMVVCAECRGLPLVWALSSALPQLAKIEARSKETDSIAVVRAIIDGARDELRRIAGSAPPADSDPASAPSAAPVRRVLAELAERPELGPDGEGLLRVLYFLSGELPVIEGKRGSNRGTPDRTLIMRVPWCGASAADAARVWTELALNFAEPRTPIMCIVPLDQPWLDVIIGDPTEAQLTCIRSSLERIPLTTSVPYNMDEAFVRRCRELIAEGQKAVADRRGAARGPETDRDDMRTMVAPIKPKLAGGGERAGSDGRTDTWVERVTVRNDGQAQTPAPAPTPAPARPELSKPEVKLPVAPESLRPVERQIRPPPLPADAQRPPEIRRPPVHPPVQPPDPDPVAPTADEQQPRKGGMSGPMIGMIILGGLALAAVAVGAGLKWGKFAKANGQGVGDSRPPDVPTTAPADPSPARSFAPGDGAKPVEPVRPMQAQAIPISFPAGDPRADWPGAQSITAARETMAALEKEFGAKPDAATEGELSRVEERWSRLRNRPIDEQRDLIDKEVVEVAAMARKLEDQLKRTLDEKRQQTRWLAALRAKKQVSASDSLNRHWQKHVIETLPPANQSLPQQQYAAIKASATAWEAVLKRIDNELPAPQPRLKVGKAWADSLGDEPAQKREGAVAEALAAVRVDAGKPHLNDSALDAAKQNLEKWAQSAVAIVEDHARLERLLDSLAALDDKAEGRSAREIYTAWEGKAKAAAPAAAAPRIAALHTRVKPLLDIEQSQDRAKLAAVNGPPEAKLAAWRRLSSLPASASDLAREAGLHERLISALDGVADAARRAALVSEVREGASSRWQAAMGGAKDAAAIEELIKHMAAYGVEPSTLDARLRFNILLHQLKGRVTSAGDEAEVRKAVDELAAAVKAGGLPQEATLLARTLRDGSESGAGDEFAPGPAADASWKKEPFDGGLRFVADGKDGAKHAIEFVRVSAEGTTPFYILSSEISLGLLAHAVSSKGSWQTFSGLMGAGDDDPRGAWGWRWADSSRNGLALSQRWIDRRHTAFLEDPRNRAAAEEPYEARELRDTVAAPGWQMPAQQVTAPAAAYVAALLKCRLPTAAEWKAAHAHQRQAETRVAPNLRDRTWAEQHRHVNQKVRDGLNVDFPDRGIFRGRERFAEGADALVWEKGLAAAKAPATDAEALHGDGVLWFRAVNVPEGERIRNLVGNVAEWVCDDPAVWKELASGKAWNKAGRLLSASKVAVIGGSALSPPEHKVDEPAPIRPEDVMRKYADVGFRLAFSAPAEPAVAKVKKAVEAQGYLFK